MDEGRGGLLPGAGGMTFLVCEDGSEYTDRFKRFLGAQFHFLRAGHFAEALALAAGADALLLDLDFRRTPRELLVDERGAPDRRGATEVQGILILRALRSRGVVRAAATVQQVQDLGEGLRDHVVGFGAVAHELPGQAVGRGHVPPVQSVVRRGVTGPAGRDQVRVAGGQGFRGVAEAQELRGFAGVSRPGHRGCGLWPCR